MSRDRHDARERGPLQPRTRPSHPASRRPPDCPPRHVGAGLPGNTEHRSRRAVSHADRRLAFVLAAAALLAITGGAVAAGRKGILLGAAGAALLAALARAARPVLDGITARKRRVSPRADSRPEEVTEPARDPASHAPPRRSPGTTERAHPPGAGADGRPEIPREPSEIDDRPPGARPARRSAEKHDVPPRDHRPAADKIRSSDGPGGFPILKVRSRAAAQPWRLPAVPSPSGVAADQASAGGLEVRAASLIGPGHRCMEPALPRQDAYRLGQDRKRRYLIAAVADGMTDSRHSEVGANTAVAAVVGLLRESLDAGIGLADLDVEEIFLAAAGR